MRRPTLPTVPLPMREIVLLTMSFERNRTIATQRARDGSRESARWWGEQARHDWSRLKDRLLNA